MGIWDWLRDEHNRGALKIVGGGIAALVVGGWSLFLYIAAEDSAPEVPDNQKGQTSTAIDPKTKRLDLEQLTKNLKKACDGESHSAWTICMEEKRRQVARAFGMTFEACTPVVDEETSSLYAYVACVDFDTGQRIDFGESCGQFPDPSDSTDEEVKEGLLERLYESALCTQDSLVRVVLDLSRFSSKADWCLAEQYGRAKICAKGSVTK